ERETCAVSLRIRRRSSPGQQFLVAQADRIGSVRAERSDTVEPFALIQADGGLLVDAGLAAEQRDAVRHRMGGEVVDQQLAEPGAAELWAHVHPLQFAIL